MPEKIQKRDGRLETWSVDRIARAILKSLRASGIKDPVLARRLAGKVQGHLADVTVPEQENVQDIVEQVLMESRLFSVARKYILYREKRREIRSQDQAFLDVTETIDGYVRGDVPAKYGLHVSHSFPGLAAHLSGAVQKRYALEQYPEEIRLAHENGYLHIHHLPFGMAGYSAGWSLETLLTEGFGFKGVCRFGPPLHFEAALGQMVSFLGAMQSEWASAQSFDHVDTLLAPFVRADGLGYEQVREKIRNFVLALNGFFRGKEQPSQCSLGCDVLPPSGWSDKSVIPGGKRNPESYADYGPEMEMINKALCDVLLKGDHAGQSLGAPVLIYTLPREFSWTGELGKMFMELISQGKSPYFKCDGDAEEEAGACDSRTPDPAPEKLRRVLCSGFPYGAGEMTGSIGVVSLNLPKLAFLAQGEMDFLALIAEYAEYARESLEFKRKFMSDYMDSGMFPCSRQYVSRGLSRHFSTIGLIGGQEACMNLLGKGIDTPEGRDLITKVLNRLDELADVFTRETGHLYNVTSLMDTRARFRLAGIDKELYSEIAISENGTPHYTDGVYLAPGHGLAPGAMRDHQHALLALFSGGPVVHTECTVPLDSFQLAEIFRDIFSWSCTSPLHVWCDIS